MTKLSPNLKHLQYPPLYVRNFATVGRRLVIIGTSEVEDDELETDEIRWLEEKYQSLYEPTLVVNVEMAKSLFGSGPLIKAYEDACTFNEDVLVYLMRIEENEYEKALSILEVFDFDLLYMDNVFFDSHADVIEMFLRFSAIKAEKGNLVHGIVSLSELTKIEDITPLFKNIELLSIDNGDDYIENGRHLSVVYNQGEFKNAGAVYAGILASLEPEVSPVNKTIPNFTLISELTKDEIKALRAAGVVCFRNTFKKGVTCTSSPCAVSTEGSVHKQVSNFRIAQFLVNRLSEELQIFVGRPHLAFQLTNIRGIVESVCHRAISDNRIREFDYSIATNELNGIVRLDIECVPVFSVHSITTHTQVRVFT